MRTDTAKPDADAEHDGTTNGNLDDGVEKLAAHEAVTDESDGDELADDDPIGGI